MYSYMYVLHMRCFKHAEISVHVRRAGYSEHARHAVHHSVNTVIVFVLCVISLGDIVSLVIVSTSAIDCLRLRNDLPYD